MRNLLLAVWLIGQSALAFDVTSVKPNTGTQDFVRLDPQPGGRLRITNASLRMSSGSRAVLSLIAPA